MLYAWERRLPGDVSRQLLERYAWELRRCSFPFLRLEEMVYGPEGEPSEDTRQGDEGSESHYSSYTVEVAFNSSASRSHDSEAPTSEEDGASNGNGEEPDREPSGGDGEGPDFAPGP